MPSLPVSRPGRRCLVSWRCRLSRALRLGRRSSVVVLALMASPLAAMALESDDVLATVGDQQVRLEDVQNREIYQLREQLHEALRQRLHRVVIARLAETHPDFSLTDPAPITPQQVRAFYEQNGLASRGTFEQLRERIQDFLERQRDLAHLEQEYEMAIRRGLVRSHLKAPAAYLVRVSLASGFVRGNPKAPVMLLEFSDYQCPFCARAQPTLERLRKRYKDRVAFAYRHFPLPFHTEADEAAQAVECARDQGKFEPYHEKLFANQKRQFPEDLKRYARETQIGDPARFDTCLDGKRHEARVMKDIDTAREVGISATPSFIVGRYDADTNMVRGEIFSGALPDAVFVQNLDKYLAQAKQ
jgi:protein-disulfide isomerase